MSSQKAFEQLVNSLEYVTLARLSNKEANVKYYSKFTVVSLFCVLAACTNNSPEKLMADAADLLDKGQLQEASVTLKNVIKNNPGLLEAREMLGFAYLYQGLYLAAQKEFERSESKLSDEGTVALSEAYLWLEEYESIGDLEASTEGSLKDTLKLYKAIALYRSSSLSKATIAFREVTLSSNVDIAAIAKAYLLIINDDAQPALKELHRVNEAVNLSPIALQLKFTLETFSNDWPEAVSTAKRWLDLRPADYKIKTQLATALVNAGKFKDAELYVKQLLQLSPEQPYFNQLNGTILISRKDFKGATLYLDKAIKNGRSNQVTRLLAAVAHYQLENYEQAYQNLSTIIDSLPKDHYAKRLYTSIQLRLGYTQDGINTINSIPELGQEDLLYIVETSRLLVQKNELSEAKRLVDKIDASKIEDGEMLRNIGLLKLFTGESGIPELERNLDNSSDDINSIYLLLIAYIENNEYEKAYELVETRFAGKQNIIGRLTAKGFVQRSAGDMNAAQETYSQLRELKPENFDAMLFFIEQSIREKDFENAASKLSDALEVYPLSTRLLMRSFQVHQRIGDLSPSISQLESAQSQSEDPQYALLYAAALLLDEQYKLTVDFLRKNEISLENVPKYWMLLGNAYAKQANYNEARNAFSKWRKQAPSVSSFVQSIELEEIDNNFSEAQRLINEAKRTLGKNSTLDLLATRLMLLEGNNEDAKQAYIGLPETAKNSIIGHLIKGRLEIIDGNYKSALSILEPLYNEVPSTELALLIFSSLEKLGQEKRVIAFTQSHLERAASNVKLRLIFANYLLERRPKLAIEHYDSLVKSEKEDSPLVLNNLAWLLNEDGKPARALNHIEKANELVPNNPNILSTYAAILSSLSEHEKAIQKANDAFVLSNKNASIGINYVRVLIKAGRKNEAKRVASSIIPVTIVQETQLNELKQQFQL